ncbi:protein eyes shut, partial [Biomphalaria glabrata]
FTGKHCETKVSPCQSQPCQNNGLCQEIEVGFVCSCLPGYTGDLCQTSAAECLNSSICLNGGKCYRQNSVDICKCSPYFVGPDCSK